MDNEHLDSVQVTEIIDILRVRMQAIVVQSYRGVSASSLKTCSL